MIKRTLLLASAVLFSVGHATAQPIGPWPMFRGNAAHDGRSAFAGPELPSIQWQHPLLESSFSSPAIGPEGTIYVGSADALYAIDADGNLVWSAPLDDFSISSPAVGRTTIYVGSTSGKLYAFSAETGTLDWTFTTSDEIWSSPTIGPDGTVFVGSSDNHVYAIDGRTGEERWRHAMSVDVFGSPAVNAGGTLCVVDQDGVGALLNTQDGSLRGAFSLNAEVVSSPAFGADGLLAVASTEGILFGLDAETGAARWQANLGGQLVSSPAVDASGSVFIGSSSGSLYSVHGETGTLNWSAQLGDEVYGSPLLDSQNRLYVGTVETEPSSGSLQAVDAASGSVLWRMRVESPIWSSASLGANRILYIATAGNDDRSGKLLAVENSDVVVSPAEEPVAGSELDLEVNASSSFRPSSGTLFYRRGGERVYETTEIAQDPLGEGFRAVVPGSHITERGLEYYVELSDGEITRTLPTSSAETRPIVQRVRVPSAELPIGLLPRRFHMVSVPLDVQDADPSDVLVDDYGSYNPTVWRLFHWNGSEYAEFPSLGAHFAPGTAFFLAHRTGEPFSVMGRSVDTSEPAVVTLAPGWNQVAVPFAFEVDWEEVTTVDPSRANDVREIAFYDGVEMIQNVDDLNPLQPWAGYFIRNASPQPVDIIFPNVEASTSQQDETSTPSLSSAHKRAQSYQIRLSAHGLSDNLRDTQNWIGFLPGATDLEDRFDEREAPHFAEHVRLSLVGADARFARDYRSIGRGGGVWRAELSAHPSSPQTIEVRLTSSGQLPPDFQISVVDDDNNRTIGLIDDRFRIDVGRDAKPRQLTIVVGTADFAADYLRGVAAHPTAFLLDATYPNPFRTSTFIRYGIEDFADVSLEIFDVMGRRIATLADGPHEAGRYEIEWSGLDDVGRAVANGVYFYRLRARGYTATRQMVLSR